MAKAPNSHAITRRLTKPWEFGNRRLYVYDFTQDKFFDESSKTLLTADESFGYEVERSLNELIEQPLAQYLDSLREGALAASIPWKHERALILSLIFQGQRVAAGDGDLEAMADLQTSLPKGDAYLDPLARAAKTRFRFIGGKLAQGGPERVFFFPCGGVAALPLAGAPASTPAMLFQPTSLNTFFAAVPTELPEHVAEDQLRDAMSNGLITAYSMGLISERIIIPPPIREATDDITLKKAVLMQRSAAKRIAELVYEATRIVGL